MTEEWRPTHHPNYEVSNLGRVRSYAKRGSNTQGVVADPVVLRAFPDRDRYPHVALGRGGRVAVHRLVAAAFIGPCSEGQEVRHKDDDPTNPRANNLEYGTRRDNILDSVRRGRWARPRKLSSEQVVEVKRLLGTMPNKAIAARFDVSPQLITSIKKGRQRVAA